MEKILLLSVAQGRGSGAERVLEYLMTAGNGALKDRLLIVSPRHSALEAKAAELSYEWLAWEASGDSFSQNFIAFLRLIRRPELKLVRIIHGWGTRSFEWVVLLSCLLRKTGLGTLHDSPRAYFHGGLRQWIIRWSTRFLKRYVCVSRALEGECIAVGCPPSGCIIYNGLPDEPVVQRNTDSQVHIGFLGASFRWKGIDLVAEWIKKTMSMPVRWHFFGEPSTETSAYIKEITNFAGHRFTCHGFQTALSIYPKIDLVIHPSKQFDSLPTVLIESARAGLPVLASRIGGTEEVVVDQQTGFVYELNDEEKGLELLVELIKNEQLRLQLGKEARRRFESHFQVNVMLKNYTDLWGGC